MDTIDRIDGLIAGITGDDIGRMVPARRQRLAQALRRVADMCDPPAKTEPSRATARHNSGVLAQLWATD